MVFPYSGALGNGLRATGDVKFTMVVAIASTIGIRFLFSYLFGVVLHMGVMGIAIAMCLDWLIRAVLYYGRLKSGKCVVIVTHSNELAAEADVFFRLRKDGLALTS